MSKDVTYWLVEKETFLMQRREFMYMSAAGAIDVTENPKKAMRWIEEEGATHWAKWLGWPWRVAKIIFPGDELAI